MVRQSDGSLKSELVHIDEPILRIPTLAIHLERQKNFEFNDESQLLPIAGLLEAELARLDNEQQKAADKSVDDKKGFAPLKSASERHHPYIVELIAKELSIDASAIIDFEMLLYDVQKATLGGFHKELVYSARLDNLNSTYCATAGLIDSVASDSDLDEEESIRLVALFDHEEIGSQTPQGADSSFLPSVLRRLSVLPIASDQSGPANQSDFEQSMARSFVISADMAHAVHPNYAGKYEADHRPALNHGPVIKINANARYMSDAPGIALLNEVARLAPLPVPLQLFVVRNDSLCGSTIGPLVAAQIGARTLDLGNSQLSMHSIRETGGAKDVAYEVSLFESFFRRYSQVVSSIHLD